MPLFIYGPAMVAERRASAELVRRTQVCRMGFVWMNGALNSRQGRIANE